jgi:predicted MFS family arabinose efflux permease
MRVLGYSLGGVLIAVIGVAGVYYIVVGSYIASVVLLLMVTARGEPVDRAKTSVRTDLREGLRYIGHNRLIVLLLTLEFVPVLIAQPYMNLLPVFAVDVFGRGSQGLGFLMGAAGAGSLIGALIIASLGDFKRKGRLLLSLAFVFSVMLTIFAFSQSFTLSVALLFGVGAGGAGYFATNNTLIQSNITDEVRGRVMSIYSMTFALGPLGTLLIGAAVDQVGAHYAVGGVGIIVTLFILAMAIMRPDLRRLE